MRYRAEIDGLRALAVIPVILFHAGFALFGGGYVGVDVFFVISGYLITTLVLGETRAGAFRLVRFYERRARRILPALFLTMAACVPFAWLWLLPGDFDDFAKSLAGVALFASNVLFWRQSGYFDTAAELKPLLHTWSLAVEEQFYVVFPLLLLVLSRLGKRRLAAGLAAVALGSLALAQAGAVSQPAAAFFLLPARAWELALGALVAVWLDGRPGLQAPRAAAELAGVAGLLLILYGVFAYGKSTPFPGVYALAPTLGAALVILFARPHTLAGRLLASKPFVGVGLISYSAYLWHQPLFAFARHRSLGAPGAGVYAALIAAAFLLALASWRFVERPFRQPGRVSRRGVFAFAALGTAAFLALGLAGHFGRSSLARPLLPAAITQTFERPSRAAACFDKEFAHTRPDWLCRLGDGAARPSFVLVGDSHALSLLDLFDGAAKSIGAAGVFAGASGCPPLLGIYALRGDQGAHNCHALNARVAAYVKAAGIKRVVLVGRWSYYTDGGYDGRDYSYLGRAPGDARAGGVSRAAFAYGVGATAQYYRTLGVEVDFVEQVPQQEYEPQRIFVRAYRGGRVNPELLARYSVPLAKVRSLAAYVTAVVGRESGLRPVSFADLFCAATCLVGDAGGSYYFDADHLSAYGARRAAGRVRELLAGAR
jgi:peptidoglycan/LPS O-acetylase OafA/YrhL